MLKKILSFILALTIVFGVAPLAGFIGIELPNLKEFFSNTSEAATLGPLTYKIKDNEVTITGCNSSASGDLEIPATIDGYPVKIIDQYAFSDCKTLTSVTIPDSVISIGDSAFSGCTSITGITVDINNNYYSSDETGVLFNKDKTELIQYPAGNESADYEIPDSVTIIDSWAFEGCKELKRITIPNSVTSIGDGAFSGCTSIIGITVDINNSYYSSDETGVLFNKNKTALIQYPTGNDRTYYDIPDSVTNISESAFCNCLGLTSITIPNSVTDIGYYAFYGCAGLISVKIPDSVTNIGNNAFCGCDRLTNIIIGNSVTSIGNNVFKDCSSLTSVTIPDSVTEIGDYAFYDCTNLISVTIPGKVTSIGKYAFFNCIGLVNVEIPDSVTDIGKYAFYNCSGLTGVTIGDNVISISDYAFDFCTGLTNIIIGNSVTSIGNNAFKGCKNLTGVKIPGSVTSIGKNAFSDCTGLTSVTIPDSVKNIGEYAFQSCTSLENIHIPSSVTVIGNKALNGSPAYICSDTESCYAKTYASNNGIRFELCKGHSHVHTLKVIHIPETCTADGMEYEVCSECGNTIGEINITPALGHDFGEWTIIQNPTCVYTGAEKRKCCRCNCEETRSINALGHDFSTEWTVDKEATCTADGSKSHHCSRCSEKADITIIPALGHNFGEWTVTKNPTCINTGIEMRKCARCNYKETRSIAALGHDFSTEWTVDKYATCTADGSKSHHCSRCSEKADITVIPAKGHKYVDTVTEMTCETDGFTTHVCSVCGDSYVDSVVPARGHQFGEWIRTKEPTCTVDGEDTRTCTYGDVEETRKVDALGHDFGEWKVSKEPTCVNQGVEKRICSRCNCEETRSIAALGHDFSTEWTVDKYATCTADGSKSHHCSRCSEKADVTVIPALGHDFSEWKVSKEPTCVNQGVEKRICSRCNCEETRSIDALGHDFSAEWTVDKEATCTADGSKSHHCLRCSEKADVTVIPALGHKYADTVTKVTCLTDGFTTHTCSVCGDSYIDSVVPALGHQFSEWAREKEPDCVNEGLERRKCSRCNCEETRSVAALGHKFSDWVVEKEPTVLAEGLSARICQVCSEREEKAIDRIQIDIENNENYGLANFTVVNAQTKEPIEGASIFISTEKDGENTFTTDVNGKVSVILPVGKQIVSAYAEDCLTRNLRISVNPGENIIPLIGLSDKETYEVELTSKEMTLEEIEEAGIDTSDPSNNHVFEYELKLEFVPEIDWASLFFYMNADGIILGGGGEPGGEDGPGGGGPGGGRNVTWVTSPDKSDGGYFVIEPKEKEEEIIVYPVSEYMYLIIRGEVTWLKEMFDVEMLVINNSETDTLENLTCTLELPDGLSLAVMKEEQQSLVQTIDHIAEGESESVHWYVRGDDAGSYDLKARLQGMIMPFEEEIDEVFVTENAIQVWAGNAMHLHFEFPDAAYYGVDYPVTITLTNVSDKTLYNVCHAIKGIEQGRITYYSDGSVEKEVYMDTGFVGREFVKEFNPGDKIVIELSINILFESKLMEYQLEKMIGFVDNVESFINAYKGVMAGLNALKAVSNCVSGCIKALDKFASSSYGLTSDKIELATKLHKSLSKLYGAYTSSGNKAFDGASKLANSTLSLTLHAITSDPVEFLTKTAPGEIKSIISQVESLTNTITGADQTDISKFDIFDSIRTAISAIPIKFALRNVILTESKSNTTSIPWSYSTTKAGPQYFGVSNVSSYLLNIGKAIMAEAYEETMPSYMQLIPGLDDPFNYDDIKREIIAVENEIAEFKAKDATGEVTFKAWVERNEAATFSARVADFFTRSNSDFDISCDNETAVFDNGVLTFTGDGTISVTPLSTVDGTLIVEDSEGNRYEYVMTVVKQHDCVEGEQEILLYPSDEYDGVAVRRCTTCKDVLDVEVLSAKDCAAHTFGDWVVECEATCSSSGIRSHVCSACGYSEVEYTETAEHTPGEWETVEATEMEAEKQVRICTVCGDTVEEKYVNYIAVESVALNQNSFEILNAQNFNLIATVSPENASNKKIAWSSSNPSVAAVNYDGTVTALSPGTATITVSTADGGFTATCEVTVNPREFNVTWIADGVETTNAEHEYGTISLPDNPVKEGYTFTGWTPEVPDTMPSEDLVFTATWKANNYDAVFNANGGKWADDTTEKTFSTEYDSEIVAPESPEKQGYIFSGWTPKVGIMDDINGKEFKAVWIAATDTRYTVETYTMNTLGEYEKTVETFTGETDSTANAEYTVEPGFSLNSEKSALSGKIAADNSLALKVYIDRNTYSFTTVVDGVSESSDYLYGSMVSELAIPSKTGYTFMGWSSEIPETMPANDVTVEAEWQVNSYTVTWITDGTEVKTAVAYGAKIGTPATPVKAGYEFIGWDKQIPETMPAYNLTFTAVFEKIEIPIENEIKISIRNPSTTAINYGDAIILHADIDGTLPEGARIEWTADNGNFDMNVSSDGSTCKISPKSSGDTTFTAKVIDGEGKEISSDTQQMTAKAGLWQKIVAFFKKIFGLTKTIPEAFKGIF
ncbi:MAG: leucine-rich repeat protein [Acutalibacteraceae bacterium]